MKPLSGLPKKKQKGTIVVIDPIDSMMGNAKSKKRKYIKSKKVGINKEKY